MKITIEQKTGEWFVGQEDGENVWPTTSYPTSRLAAARVLQLLDLGPVGPQMHPESICIADDGAETP